MATAAGFLGGMLACLNAVRDTKTLWPPDALWAALQHNQRLEFGGGIALIVLTLVITIVSQTRTS